MLTQEQVKKGYWYFQPENDFPPKAKLLDNYTNEEHLNLVLTLGDESYSSIKKREEIYRSEIPEKLISLQTLWVSHINQNTFNAICELPNLESLYVQSNKIIDITKISNLKKLKHLGLLDLTKVGDIASVCELTQIETLKLENFKKVSDFTHLSKLKKLKGLQIDGSIYTAQVIDNFDFLNSLADLKYLTFINSRGKNKSFDPISKLQNLQMLQCSTNYPKSEFKKLSQLQNLKYIGGNIEHLIRD